MKIVFLVLFVIILGFQPLTSEGLIILGKGNAPIIISDDERGNFDFNEDEKIDYFVRVHYTGNENKTYKIVYKMVEECVKGSTYSDARLKIGFTNLNNQVSERVWVSEGISAWNPWFKAKQNDVNKAIDLVIMPDGENAFPFPREGNGDDVIQSISDNKNGSFTFKKSIKELDGQPGWEGTIFFKAPQGEYYLWSIHPATGKTVSCDQVPGIAIPIIIK